MISWIKPDGRIRPLCLMTTASLNRTVVSAKNKALCSGIANETIFPMSWENVTEILPFNHEPVGYRDAFEKQYGIYAESVGLVHIDLDDDGILENIGHFEYSSGGGCGSTKTWLSVLSDDLESITKNSLGALLNKLDNYGSKEIYEFQGSYFVGVKNDFNDGVFKINNEKIEQICQFGEKTFTGVSKSFDVDFLPEKP